MGIGSTFFPKAGNAADTAMNGFATRGTVEAYQRGVNRIGSDASRGFRSNLEQELQASLGDSAAALAANLLQSGTDHKLSGHMALDAKRTALQDAMNKTVINGGGAFKGAAGA